MNYRFDEIYQGIKSGAYKQIGSGSSRRVYDLGDGNVIKAAKDIRGIMQNKNEKLVSDSCQSSVFARVVEVSEDFRFLIMPKAEGIKSMSKVFRYFGIKNLSALLKTDGLEEDIKTFRLGMGDIKRYTSWGLIDGVPYIIDYGLTMTIFKKFYKNRLFMLTKKYKSIS